MAGLVQRSTWFREFLAKTREKRRRRTGRSSEATSPPTDYSGAKRRGALIAGRSERRSQALRGPRRKSLSWVGLARHCLPVVDRFFAGVERLTTQKRRRGRARARLDENVDPGAGPVNALLPADWLAAVCAGAFADTECSLSADPLVPRQVQTFLNDEAEVIRHAGCLQASVASSDTRESQKRCTGRHRAADPAPARQ